MLLAHIDDLVRTERAIRFGFELYDEMVEAWLLREQGFVPETQGLLQFSEQLAVELYLNRAQRGAERIRNRELQWLATRWNIDVESWKLSGRSLLNRDAEGNWKFAHRSIMEYLFVKQFVSGNFECLNTEWTDQMLYFLDEILFSALFNEDVTMLMPAIAALSESQSKSDSDQQRAETQSTTVSEQRSAQSMILLFISLALQHLCGNKLFTILELGSGVRNAQSATLYREGNIRAAIFSVKRAYRPSATDLRNLHDEKNVVLMYNDSDITNGRWNPCKVLPAASIVKTASAMFLSEIRAHELSLLHLRRPKPMVEQSAKDEFSNIMFSLRRAVLELQYGMISEEKQALLLRTPLDNHVESYIVLITANAQPNPLTHKPASPVQELLLYYYDRLIDGRTGTHPSQVQRWEPRR